MAEEAVAGGLAGSAAMLLTFPLEQIRTRRQAGKKPVENSLELFRGCRSVLETIGISNFLFFYLQEGGKRAKLPPWLASTFAAVANTLLTEPLWKANTALKLGGAGGDSVFTELKRAVAAEGLLDQWRGTGVSLWLVVNPVIQFSVYENLKVRAGKKVGRGLNDVEVFVCGAVAKAAATVLTYPMQVAQTRLRDRKGEYENTIDCLVKIYQKEGIKGLFAGLSPKLAQTVLTAALMLLLYERLLRQLKSIKGTIH